MSPFWQYRGEEVREAYREQGRQEERERITALLENFDDSNLWRQTSNTAYEGFDIAEIIELIKGEQK